jgi:hypothetical protein
MTPPNFAGLAADFREGYMLDALKRSYDAHMLRNCAEVGKRDSRGPVQSIAASIAELPTLTGAEMLLLVTVLASKVRAAETVGYSDAIADAMEVELPNSLWALTEDNTTKPEAE